MTYTGYELLAFFFVYAFLGWILEIVYAAIHQKKFSNRGFLSGPLCPVYGGSMVFVLVFFQGLQDRLFFLFLGSLVVATLSELFTGMFLEKLMGRKSWDYSDYKYNLGGRINLLYCFFWGIAALVWLKICYPFLSGLIEKVPVKFGTALTWIFVVFMAVNMLVSAAALARYSERAAGEPAGSDLECLLDERFDDERMERIYPNAKMTGGESPMDE